MAFKPGEWEDIQKQMATKRPRGIERMPADQVGQFLAGFLGPFRLRRPFAERDLKTGDWVFPGLQSCWGRPGIPYITAEEMERGEVNRLHYVVREVLAEAVRTNQVDRVTYHRGEDFRALLYRCGLGHLAGSIA